MLSPLLLKSFSKPLYILATLTVALQLASCAVPIKDEKFYVDAGESGAVTLNFLSPGSEIIQKPDWDAIREGMYCMSYDAIGDFKGEIEKLCSIARCSYQVKKQFTALFRRIDRAQRTAWRLAKLNGLQN